jgi:hypothetical protein
MSPGAPVSQLLAVTGLPTRRRLPGYGGTRRLDRSRPVEVADSVKLRGHRPGVAAVVSNDPRARCYELRPSPCNRPNLTNSVTPDPSNGTLSGWSVTGTFQAIQEAG